MHNMQYEGCTYIKELFIVPVFLFAKPGNRRFVIFLIHPT